MWRFRKYTKLIIPTIFVIASSSVFFVFWSYMTKELRIHFLDENAAVKDAEVYSVTYTRIDSWMIGILVGYIMHKIEGKTVEMSKAVVTIGWTFSILGILFVTFGHYPMHQENYKDNPLVFDALFDSMKRICWCMSIGWVILACHLSYGGIVKRFLSLPIWLPISRLSFCMYLMHLPIQLIYLSSIRSPQYFSNFRAIHKFFGDFGVGFIVAFIWALMFEYPTLNIIGILTTKRKVRF